MPCSHVVDACKHAHHEYMNYIHPMYTSENVPTYTEDCLENCAMKHIGHYVTSQ